MIYIKKTDNIPVRFYLQVFQEVEDITSVNVSLFKADVPQNVEIRVLEANGTYIICELNPKDLSGEYVLKCTYNDALISSTYCIIVDRFENNTTQHIKENSKTVYEKN